MHYIDLHTHCTESSSNRKLINVFAQDLPVANDDRSYSVGLHPWHLETVDNEDCLVLIDKALAQKNVLAVGECGLDRSISTGFMWQERYFCKQAQMAEKYAKPLIIHCVRSFPELISYKKKIKATVPWIIHGYQANAATTANLMKHNFYFSAGEALLAHPRGMEILPLIPSDHLFIETDNCEIPIEELYTLASRLLLIGEETLDSIIHDNFTRLFGEVQQS